MRIEAQDDLWEYVEEEKGRECFLPGVAYEVVLCYTIISTTVLDCI